MIPTLQVISVPKKEPIKKEDSTDSRILFSRVRKVLYGNGFAYITWYATPKLSVDFPNKAQMRAVRFSARWQRMDPWGPVRR